jgi:tetratricopeptide (TPR) repeat protein
MSAQTHLPRASSWATVILASVLAASAIVGAQAGRGGAASADLQQASQLIQQGKSVEALAAARRELLANPTSLQAASLLDTLGATKDARVVFQKAVDAASDPLAKSVAQRAMAMSFAFDGDCANTVKYEQMIIAYWMTREQAEPQNAFYQQGEMANEAARVCIDSGDLSMAEQLYRKGAELGLKEPAPRTHPTGLWDFRLAHALGRVAARRGNKAEAQQHVAEARRALDSDPTMAAQQERFFPYLVGYVALYADDLKTAETELTKTVGLSGNQTDPFMQCLLAMTYERLGRPADAKALYEKAYGLATAHNPPAAFARPFARKKLGLLSQPSGIAGPSGTHRDPRGAHS